MKNSLKVNIRGAADCLDGRVELSGEGGFILEAIGEIVRAFATKSGVPFNEICDDLKQIERIENGYKEARVH